MSSNPHTFAVTSIPFHFDTLLLQLTMEMDYNSRLDGYGDSMIDGYINRCSLLRMRLPWYSPLNFVGPGEIIGRCLIATNEMISHIG